MRRVAAAHIGGRVGKLAVHRPACKQLERHHTQRPCIHCSVRYHRLRTLVRRRDDLWRGVGKGEAKVGCLSGAGGETKVDERPGRRAGQEHDVAGLEVAVHPAVAVQLRQTARHLPDYLHSRR